MEVFIHLLSPISVSGQSDVPDSESEPQWLLRVYEGAREKTPAR